MKLSLKSEYACLALIDLATHHEKGLRTTAQIAEAQKVPVTSHINLPIFNTLNWTPHYPGFLH